MRKKITENTVLAALTPEWQRPDDIVEVTKKALDHIHSAFVAPTFFHLTDLRKKKWVEREEGQQGRYRLTALGVEQKSKLLEQARAKSHNEPLTMAALPTFA